MAIPAEFIPDGHGVVDLDRDRVLVVRYQQGDQDAFDELYRRYFPRLQLYCQRRVGDRHVAEELAQESFLRALKAMPRFAGDRRFYPWMTVIAQRLCIDHHRRTARVEPAAEIDAGAVEADHDAVFQAVDHGHLATALERVAPRHREVLHLRETKGWSYTRIAEELEVPVTTVEALLHRARRALRREFLSVSSGSRLAGLPVLGWLSLKVARIRTKIGVAWEASPITHVVAPAVAGMAAVTFTLAPVAPSATQGVATPASVSAATSTEITPVAVEPAPGSVEVSTVMATTTTTRPPAPAEPQAAAAPPSPDHDYGPVKVYSSPEGVAYSEEQAKQMPIHIPFADGTLGIDPAAVVPNLLDYLLTGKIE